MSRHIFGVVIYRYSERNYIHVVQKIYIGLFPYKFVPEFPLKFLQYQEMYGIYTILGTLEKHAMEC